MFNSPSIRWVQFTNKSKQLLTNQTTLQNQIDFQCISIKHKKIFITISRKLLQYFQRNYYLEPIQSSIVLQNFLSQEYRKIPPNGNTGFPRLHLGNCASATTVYAIFGMAKKIKASDRLTYCHTLYCCMNNACVFVCTST